MWAAALRLFPSLFSLGSFILYIIRLEKERMSGICNFLGWCADERFVYTKVMVQVA